MLDLPCIAVASSSTTKPKSLIKYILKEDPNPDENSHIWSIDNKYYTADVQFLEISDSMLNADHKNFNIEALLMHINSNSDDGLEAANKYLSLDEYHTPEVKILLANYCNDKTKVSRSQVLEWCLEKGFEFVELFPEASSESEDEEFVEKQGIERVLEALHATMWTNMQMKHKEKPKTNEKAVENGEEQLEDDDFMNMFSNLMAMKNSIASMPTNERKQCAEQVVTAFWKAIGGDESEISDLSN